jgi:hypothetical protein
VDPGVLHRHSKPLLMEGDEADHKGHGEGRLLLIPRGKPLRVHPEGAGAKQPQSTKPYRSSSVTEEKIHGSRGARKFNFSTMAK